VAHTSSHPPTCTAEGCTRHAVVSISLVWTIYGSGPDPTAPYVIHELCLEHVGQLHDDLAAGLLPNVEVIGLEPVRSAVHRERAHADRTLAVRPEQGPLVRQHV
jgi:hypothetical protein